jgi:hypothetical protein
MEDDDSDPEDDIVDGPLTQWRDEPAERELQHSESYASPDLDRTCDPTYMCSYLEKQVRVTLVKMLCLHLYLSKNRTQTEF